MNLNSRSPTIAATAMPLSGQFTSLKYEHNNSTFLFLEVVRIKFDKSCVNCFITPLSRPYVGLTKEQHGYLAYYTSIPKRLHDRV